MLVHQEGRLARLRPVQLKALLPVRHREDYRDRVVDVLAFVKPEAVSVVEALDPAPECDCKQLDPVTAASHLSSYPA